MKKTYAIFIDGDNIAPSLLEPIISAVLKNGDVAIKRLYGDWSTVNMNGWKKLLETVPIKAIQQFRNGPNATDNAIIMDVIEIINANRNINSVCIASTDVDYYSLALRLREYGIHVLGIGRSNANPLWVKSCNDFIYIENLESQPSSNLEDIEEKHESIVDILCMTYKNSNMTEDGWVNLADLGRIIKNIMPDFDVKTYNHDTLKALIASLSDFFELKHNDTMPPIYWFKPKDKKRKE